MNPQYAPALQPLHSPQGLTYLFDLNGQLGEPDEPQVEEIRFSHLRTHQEIAQVLHLRDELNLPAAIRDDPEFVAREKKETKSGLSAPLSGGAQLLELFDSFPLDLAWHRAIPYWTNTRSVPTKEAGRLGAWFLPHSTGPAPSF